MQSKITGGKTTILFTALILKKYEVKYCRCNETGFIQTESPFWLEEAYSSAITKLDIGLPGRNLNLSNIISKVLINNFNTNGLFLDYAGGYGLFTRLMRDKGFKFYNTDKFCKNLFAEYFDLSDLPANATFEAITAFEVFEHLIDPLDEIKQMLQYSSNLFFTTELQPASINSIDDWSYFSTETGQHISFYNTKSLQFIAQQLGFNFYSDGSFLHLFTKKTFTKNPLLPARDSFIKRKIKKLAKKFEYQDSGNMQSLLMDDWRYIKNKINC